MKYDFTSVIDRRGWDAIAVDAVYEEPGFGPDAPKEGFDVIPMWVADMNFKAVPTIQEAMIHRIEHPAYGYFNPRKEYTDAIISWQEKEMELPVCCRNILVMKMVFWAELSAC